MFYQDKWQDLISADVCNRIGVRFLLTQLMTHLNIKPYRGALTKQIKSHLLALFHPVVISRWSLCHEHDCKLSIGWDFTPSADEDYVMQLGSGCRTCAGKLQETLAVKVLSGGLIACHKIRNLKEPQLKGMADGPLVEMSRALFTAATLQQGDCNVHV